MRTDQYTSGTPLELHDQITHSLKLVAGPPVTAPLPVGQKRPATAGVPCPPAYPQAYNPGTLIPPISLPYYNPPMGYDSCTTSAFCRASDERMPVPPKPGWARHGHGCTCGGSTVGADCECDAQGYLGENYVPDRPPIFSGTYRPRSVYGPKATEESLIEAMLVDPKRGTEAVIQYLQQKGEVPTTSGPCWPPKPCRPIRSCGPLPGYNSCDPRWFRPHTQPRRLFWLLWTPETMPNYKLRRCIASRLNGLFDAATENPNCFAPGWRYNNAVHGPKVSQSMTPSQIASLAEVMAVEQGFPGVKSIIEANRAELEKELRKRGFEIITLKDGTQLVGGPFLVDDGTTGSWFSKAFKSVKKAVGGALKGVGDAVKSAAKTVNEKVLKPVGKFVSRNAKGAVKKLKQLDKKLGITKGLKKFAKGAGSFLKDNWPALAGIALTAVTGGAAAPLLGSLGAAGGSILPMLSKIAPSLLGGGGGAGGGGVADLIGKLGSSVLGSSGGDLGSIVSKVLGDSGTSGGLMEVLGKILGEGEGALAEAGEEIEIVAKKESAGKGTEAIAALFGGDGGLLDALGGNAKGLPDILQAAAAPVAEKAAKSGEFDFASLLANLQEMAGAMRPEGNDTLKKILASLVGAPAVARSVKRVGGVPVQAVVGATQQAALVSGMSPTNALAVGRSYGEYCSSTGACAPFNPTVEGSLRADRISSSGTSVGTPVLVALAKESCRHLAA